MKPGQQRPASGVLSIIALVAMCGPSQGEPLTCDDYKGIVPEPLTCDELKDAFAVLEGDFEEARRGHEFAYGYRLCLETVELKINEAQADFETLPEDERGEGGPNVEFPDCASGFAPLTAEETTARLKTAKEREENAWQILICKDPELTRVRNARDVGCN